MCLYPKLILNPKYRSTKKNGGNIPPISDERVKYVPVGCSNCIECRKQYARGWQIRLLEDIKTQTNGKFITLTFNNQSIKELHEAILDQYKLHQITEMPTAYELDNAIATLATRRFLERWRKEHKKSLRHFLITELGHNGTENIHLHGIVWTNEHISKVRDAWKYGYIWPRKDDEKTYVSEETVNYITKYITKIDEVHKTYKARILTSAGIGKNYTNRPDAQKNTYNGTKTDETYRTRKGNKIAMPTYWRNKIYSEEEREKLWLQKLDQEVRYICGEKISTKNGYEEYFKTLEYHRKRNQQLGYGTDEKDWQQEQYERQRRLLKQKQRLQAAE